MQQELPDDVRRALGLIPPLIWHMGPLPVDLSHALEGNPRYSVMGRFSLEGLKADTKGKVVLFELTNPTDEELTQLKLFTERTLEALVSGEEMYFGDDVLYSVRTIRCVVVQSDRIPPKDLLSMLWPCGTPTDFQCPTTDEVPTHFIEVASQLSNYKVDEGLVLKPTVSHFIAEMIVCLSLVKGRARVLAKKGIDCGTYSGWVTQEIYDEAVAEWADLRAKFNLYSGLA